MDIMSDCSSSQQSPAGLVHVRCHVLQGHQYAKDIQLYHFASITDIPVSVSEGNRTWKEGGSVKFREVEVKLAA